MQTMSGSQPRAESERLREGMGLMVKGIALVIAWSKSWVSRGYGTTDLTTGLALPIVYSGHEQSCEQHLPSLFRPKRKVDRRISMKLKIQLA